MILIDVKDNEMLLKEVHHRIKNNMSVMTSLLSLHENQMKAPEDKMIIRDAENQLRGMGLLYDRLYRSENYREMKASEYLPSLVEEIVNTFPKKKKVRIQTNVDDFMIGIKVIPPIGIIINELITNIMKYAFVGREKGEIVINASMKMNTIHLEVCDNGIGMPESVSFENSTGFGLILIGSLTKQLDGNIWIEREVGTKVILEFEN